ncbi:unnamed protein product, partial [Symbiodinium sp. KB8]
MQQNPWGGESKEGELNAIRVLAEMENMDEAEPWTSHPKPSSLAIRTACPPTCSSAASVRPRVAAPAAPHWPHQRMARDVRDAMAKRAEEAWHFYQQGAAKLEQDEPVGAESDFREALCLNPDSADAHHGLGWALLGQGDLAGAERSFLAALQLRPSEIRFHGVIGRLYRHFRGDPRRTVQRQRK